MLASAVKGHPVMSVATATTVGKLESLLVDPDTSRVVGLTLSKTTTTPKDSDTLHWEDLKSFGPDAITIASDEAIMPAHDRAAELSGKKMALLGKLVLDDHGNALGKVDDIDFDLDTGEVHAVTVDKDTVVGARLIGLGSYALVVKALDSPR